MKNQKKEPKKPDKELTEGLVGAKESLEAYSHEKVDAMITKDTKEKECSLPINQEHPFHFFIENMSEAALILSKEGMILYGYRKNSTW